jgi:hypothetical protein
MSRWVDQTDQHWCESCLVMCVMLVSIYMSVYYLLIAILLDDGKGIHNLTEKKVSSMNVMLFAEKRFIERLADALDSCEPFNSYTDLLSMKRTTHFALPSPLGRPLWPKNATTKHLSAKSIHTSSMNYYHPSVIFTHIQIEEKMTFKKRK